MPDDSPPVEKHNATISAWRMPDGGAGMPQSKLRLTNSLTRRKEIFVPERGNHVNWYICGPTVYDSAHMGHARSYVAFDILRRVMTDYFGYNVTYVMNITDIDDKIIKRARQRYLFGQYVEKGYPTSKVLNDIAAALGHLKEKNEAETNPARRQAYRVAVTNLESSLGRFSSNPNSDVVDKLLNEDAKEAVSEWLDAHRPSTWSVPTTIFNALARQYESEFLDDMSSLNVLPPDVLTRVSEYVPEIVDYVQRIVDNGYAYQANGSVYFDTAAFDGHCGHRYAKLLPEAFTTAAGAQPDHQPRGEKRNASDFAIWKGCKPGEPCWPSPWGEGRPGWHIECSAMASAMCGPRLDVHAGGFDLKFPHHDNELAQSEAYFKCDQWVNYFLHAGTLQIAGLKMSKSLKNFVTIKDALKQYTPRQIRLWFLLHRWEDALDYSHSNMHRALQFEKTVLEFLLCVDCYLRKYFKKSQSDSYRKFGEDEMELQEYLRGAKVSVDEALRDSIDTRSALDAIRELIAHSNSYIARANAQRKTLDCSLLRNTSSFVKRILKVFGAPVDEEKEGGFEKDSDSDQCKEHLVTPFVDALCKFREQVRQVAKEKKIAEILAECDRVRDDVLPELGVRLEDREGHTVVKLVDRETLIKQREQERELAEQKRLEKERKRAVMETKEAQRRVPPSEMFKRVKEEDGGEKYSKFDQKGIPTHDAKGEELGKKTRQKLINLYEAQERRYANYTNGISSSANANNVK